MGKGRIENDSAFSFFAILTLHENCYPTGISERAIIIVIKIIPAINWGIGVVLGLARNRNC